MTQNDLNKYFSKINFDSKRKNEILLSVMDKKAHKCKKKHVRLHMLAACFAMISVLSIIATAVVANRVAIHELLQSYLRIGDVEEIQYIEPDTKQYSCFDKDVRINILQTISDNKTIYVLYEIILPANETAVAQNDPDAVSFSIDGIANGAYTTKTLSISKNTIQNMIIYDTPEQITPQNELMMSINEIFTEHNTIEGNWVINWTLGSKSDNISFNTNITLSKNNSSVIINQIYLSPLSLSLGVQTDNIASITDNIPTVTLQTLKGEVSVNKIIDDKAIYYNQELGTGEIYYRFNRMLTIEDLTGITIENQYIDLNGE